MEIVCVLCDRPALAEVEVALGLPAGMCRGHLADWVSKHPELLDDFAPVLSERS